MLEEMQKDYNLAEKFEKRESLVIRMKRNITREL